MRIVAISISILMILVSFSGCLSDDEAIYVTSSNVYDFGSYSVVAPIDTGINVYHNHFIIPQAERSRSETTVTGP